MKLRTQLILFFLALAALPLSAAVLYSYLAELASFNREARVESQGRVEELSARMAVARARDPASAESTLPAAVIETERIQDVLGEWSASRGEIAFAIDRRGELHFAKAEDGDRLAGLPIEEALVSSPSPDVEAALRGWVVKGSEATNPRFVIARSVARPRARLRAKAGRNLAIGITLIGLSILAMLPMLRRLTRSLDELTLSAERLAQGDLTAQVRLRSSSELGRLARAFNRMAGDLEGNQRLLLAQEGERREHEVDKRVLQAENDRQNRELEEARRFQLSLLPRTLPKREGLEVAVAMRTATEVGGDYYDFHLASDGSLTAVVGDATGHGAVAGRMVTVLKSLFIAQGGSLPLTQFLDQAAATVRGMELGRVMMALCLARLRGRTLQLSSAAMPPVLIYRAATSRVEEVAMEGMPLGGIAGRPYDLRTLQLEAGDAVLLMSDGFPELPNAEGELLGYPRAEAAFQDCGDKSARAIVASLLGTIKSWNGGVALPDDATFVVLRLTVS